MDYLLAECADQSRFERLAQMKANLKAEINKQFLNREKKTEQIQKNAISLNIDNLFKKDARSGELKKYL